MICFLHSEVRFYLRIYLLVSKSIIIQLNQVLLIKCSLCTFCPPVSHEGDNYAVPTPMPLSEGWVSRDLRPPDTPRNSLVSWKGLHTLLEGLHLVMKEGVIPEKGRQPEGGHQDTRPAGRGLLEKGLVPRFHQLPGPTCTGGTTRKWGGL